MSRRRDTTEDENAGRYFQGSALMHYSSAGKRPSISGCRGLTPFQRFSPWPHA
jgi:hypothetical protein